MSDCHYGVSPVNYPDPDPGPILEVFRKRAWEKLLPMNVNLDSTKIIITEHKVVASFFLEHFFITS